MDAWVTALDVQLVVKAVAFIPDNYWLWTNGPNIRRRIAAHGSLTVEHVEKYGAPPCCHGRAIPRRGAASLKFWHFGSNKFWCSLGMVAGLLLRTPVLAAQTFVAIFFVSSSGWMVRTAAVLCAAIAAFTLIASAILRMSLGSLDKEYSDVKGLTSIFKSRGHMTAVREGLALHFVILVLLSILFYSCAYAFLATDAPSNFVFDPSYRPGGFGWAYYSLTVVATTTDGTVRAAGQWAKFVVSMQLCTGPLLVFWFVSLFISDDS